MSVRYLMQHFFAVTMVAVLYHTSSAQTWTPFGPVDTSEYNDLAPFERFEVRNFKDAPDPHEGFFFTYDKLSWAFPGERTTIGSTTAQFNSITYFRGSPDEAPIVPNSLTDGFPDASFGWGDRFELGYIVGHHGWQASYLNGPHTTENEIYGFGPDFGNTTTPAVPFVVVGSVMIAFEAPAGYFDGFTDVLEAEQGGVMYLDADGDGKPDGVDGFADDWNDNQVHGPDGIDVPPIGGEPDLPVGPTDFGDLVTFLPTFQQVQVQNHIAIQGIELMKTYRFDPTHRGSIIEFYYGARYFRLRDDMRVDTFGGTIGQSFWDTRLTNNLVGPQLGLKWMNQRGRWNFNAQGKFLFGYNVQNWEQDGLMGGNLMPSSHNSPLYANPHALKHGRTTSDFSPLAELRVETSYHFTQHFAAKLGYTATYVDNIRRAATSVHYALPGMGFKDNGTQDIFISGVNIGFEFNH